MYLLRVPHSLKTVAGAADWGLGVQTHDPVGALDIQAVTDVIHLGKVTW